MAQNQNEQKSALHDKETSDDGGVSSKVPKNGAKTYGFDFKSVMESKVYERLKAGTACV